MGSIFKAQTPPPPPPPPPPSTIRDEIGGVEQVPVVNEDGSTTYVTRKIPLTAEQQAEKDELESIMKDALTEIQKISSEDYQHDSSTQKVLDSWEETQRELLNDSTVEREQSEEKLLARRGLSDSSAARSVRRQRHLDKQAASKQIQREKDLLSSDIRNEQLGLQQNLYNIASSQQNADVARTFQSAARGQGSLISSDASRRASIASYYNRSRQVGPSLFGQLAGVAGTALGASFGGPIGAQIGGAIGSHIGQRI